VARASTPGPIFRGGAALAGAAIASALLLASRDSAAEGSKRQEGAWRCHEQVCQRETRSASRVSLEIRNGRAVAVWVVIEPRALGNLKALDPTPFTARIAPGEIRPAGSLAIVDATRPHSYQAAWQILAGDPDAVHDDRARYRMPFGGPAPITVSQGYDGGVTHTGLGANALDFPMPVGTPILAARDGTIVEVVDDQGARAVRSAEERSKLGGDADRAEHADREGGNRVVIEHADGTLALYAHLRRGGPARVGERVRPGEPIGFSGDTGLSTGPHLHFEVYAIRRDGQRHTIPVRFEDGTDAGFVPVAGRAYAPASISPDQ